MTEKTAADGEKCPKCGSENTEKDFLIATDPPRVFQHCLGCGHKFETLGQPLPKGPLPKTAQDAVRGGPSAVRGDAPKEPG